LVFDEISLPAAIFAFEQFSRRLACVANFKFCFHITHHSPSLTACFIPTVHSISLSQATTSLDRHHNGICYKLLENDTTLSQKGSKISRKALAALRDMPTSCGH
jgi:hypothetical protein